MPDFSKQINDFLQQFRARKETKKPEFVVHIPSSVPIEVQSNFTDLFMIYLDDVDSLEKKAAYVAAAYQVLNHCTTQQDKGRFQDDMNAILMHAYAEADAKWEKAAAQRSAFVNLRDYSFPQRSFSVGTSYTPAPAPVTETKEAEEDTKFPPTPSEFLKRMADFFCDEDSIPSPDLCAGCPAHSITSTIREHCRNSIMECAKPEAIYEFGGEPSEWYPPEYSNLVYEIWFADDVYAADDGEILIAGSNHPCAVDGEISIGRLILEDILILEDPVSPYLRETAEGGLVLINNAQVHYLNGDNTDFSPANITLAMTCACCGAAHVPDRNNVQAA